MENRQSIRLLSTHASKYHIIGKIFWFGRDLLVLLHALAAERTDIIPPTLDRFPVYHPLLSMEECFFGFSRVTAKFLQYLAKFLLLFDMLLPREVNQCQSWYECPFWYSDWYFNLSVPIILFLRIYKTWFWLSFEVFLSQDSHICCSLDFLSTSVPQTQSNYLRPGHNEAEKNYLVGFSFAIYFYLVENTRLSAEFANSLCWHMHYIQFVQQSQEQSNTCIISSTQVLWWAVSKPSHDLL